uniref:Uncharacterized protein n=1 Tax=Crocodylus porosus TaxID=8502 RepID=A0A7M4DZT4_CROPO
MVKASCPIHSNICLLFVQLHSTGCRKKCKTLLTSLHLLAVLRHIIWADRSQKFNVVITMVLGHFFCIRFTYTYIDLHFSVKAIVQQEVMGHSDPVGLHWMALAIIVVSNIPWKQEVFVITDFPLGPLRQRHFPASRQRQTLRDSTEPAPGARAPHNPPPPAPAGQPTYRGGALALCS